MKPLFLGLSGPSLTGDERALFAEAAPAGYILFARNIETPEQVRALTAELRALSARERLPILIDQEGGRVARLRPPHWPEFPAARRFGAAFDRAPVTGIEAARTNARALAAMLIDLGITVDCLPVLDVPVAGAHDIIGDRAFGEEPEVVSALGDATLRGLREGGVVGVVKHMPGHGRASVDSHKSLPVVDSPRELLVADFEPFRRLSQAPMAMTAHVIYTAIDPSACASLSPIVIQQIVRGEIGFTGLLMSDDLGMRALAGPVAARAAAVLAAGCDIALHCSGDFAEMAEVCAAVPEIGELVAARLDAAMRWAERRGPTKPLGELAAARDRLLDSAA